MRLDLVVRCLVSGLCVVACASGPTEQEKQRAVREYISARTVGVRQASAATVSPPDPAPGLVLVPAPRDAQTISEPVEDVDERRRQELRASCAADREERFTRRKQEALRDARRREQEARLTAYRKKHCTMHSQATSIIVDGVEWDEEGYLRQRRAVAVESYYECPKNGPPGARGRVAASVTTAGSPGAPERVARLSDEILRSRVFPGERDNLCRAADEEAQAAGEPHGEPGWIPAK